MDSSAALDLTEALRRPIAGPDPSGRDTRYDPEHLAILAEVEKLDPVASGGGAVDWGAMCERALAILRGQSKDLRVASYLCVGIVMTEGLAGLTAVLLGIATLIREQWAGLHPRGRERRKLTPIEWALGRLMTHFEVDRGASAVDIKAATAALLELEAALVAAGVAHVSALVDLVRILEGWADSQVATVEAVPAGAVEASKMVRPESELSTPPADEGRASELSVVSVMTSMRVLARRMRGEDPSQAQAYRLLRLGIWLDVVTPLSTRNGRSTWLPVDPRTRVAIERAEAAREWQEVVDLAERACERAPLALDLQQHCHRALVELGPQFREASQVVAEETLRLVARDRDILDALARDGSALVGAETRGWLASLTPATTTMTTDMELDGEPEVSEPDALLQRLEARLAASGSARSRADLRLQAALRLGEMGRQGAAVQLLAPLVLDFERRGLVEWDPEFCAGVAEALIRAARQATVREAASVVEVASRVLWMVKPFAGARFQPS